MAMMLGKPKVVVKTDFINLVVREYFNAVSDRTLTGREVSELFRHAICVLLGLDSRIAPHLQELSKYVVNRLRYVTEWPDCRTEIEKCGYLEAFVHVMEAARGGACAC